MVAAAEQLIGRTAEIGLFEHALDALSEGRPGAVQVVGEPGMGKTRMLAELAERADARGNLVLAGSGSELERGLPFRVFLDGLDDYVRGLEPRRVAALEEETRAQLGELFPSLRQGRTPRNAGDGDERFHTHRAIGRLLEVLARPKGLVLLLDDLHWADSGSVELLGSLLRRPPGGVLLALALRPRPQSELLQGALERAERDGLLTRIELQGLGLDEARELLGTSVSAAAAAELHAEAGGNPFYLEQLARSPRRPREAAGDLSLTMEVPAAVAASLAEELALLPQEVRRVLEGAAVAGDPFEPELAAAAGALPEETAMDALDELLRRDLVRPTELPRRFRFRHPLVRRAVYEAAPGGWRLTAHERAAEALAARGASPAERAHHVEASARRGDMAAVALLTQAGEATAPRAPAGAARFYAAALRLLPETASAEERLEVLSALAQAHDAAGQVPDAYRGWLACLELVPEEAVALRVRVTAACAGAENLLSLHDQAHARLVDAVEELSGAGAPERWALMVQLSVDGLFRMEYESMRAWAERALEAAEDKPAMAAATGLVAMGAASSGAVEDAARMTPEAAALLGAMSDDELARCLTMAAQSTIGSLAYLDRYRAAEELAERSLTVARATGQGQLVPLLFWVGLVRRMRGRLDDAVEVIDTAVEIARLSAHAQAIAWNLFSRSLTATAAGEVEVALAAAEESLETVPHSEASLPAMWAGFALAAARCEAGGAAGAEEVLVTSAGGEELPLVPAAWRTTGLELLTRCRLARGDRAGAELAAARTGELAAAQGLPMAAAFADRAAAAVALDGGGAEAAAARARASAERAEEIGAPVEAALSRMLAGRALAASGDKAAAAAELERAAAGFAACGAVARRDQAERELGKLGRRPHRRTRPGKRDGTGIESLSERELEVARLVVDRKTNAQIASELFLSPKTVETHIRHLFEKLGVSSRVEVARVVERAERALH
jgi:ATP/maltotriose-dependent transcriptional regulator MalT